LDKPLAPGQLDIVLMKKIYGRIGNNLKSKWTQTLRLIA
jgi:hypothetical protein